MTTKRGKKLLGVIGVAVAAVLLAGCGDFKLDTTPITMSVPQGRSGTTKITVTRERFDGEISFSLTGAPSGVTYKFDPAKTDKKGTETTLTLTVADTVATQKYTLKVVAQSGNKKKERTLELTVQVKPDFTLAATPTSLTVRQGASGTVTVNITRNATFTGAVALTLEGAPAGVTGTFSPASVTGASSTLTLSVAPTAAAGTYSLTIRGKGDGIDKTVAVRLTVEPLPDFSMSLSPAAVTLKPGGTATVAVNLTRVGGFADAVELSVEGLPVGVTPAFEPSTVTANTSTLTLTSVPTVATGSYQVVVRGIGGGKNKTAILTLTIAP
ncbi:MAG: hypothetical protein N2320_01235 [Candidatus Bipolaricaulota bacterium]|nr:hypothetical protein [Candidatus Bipolaricaulota bacterium]